MREINLDVAFDEKPIVIKKAKALVPASSFEKWVTAETKIPLPAVRLILICISLLFFMVAALFYGKFFYLKYNQEVIQTNEN